MLVELRVRDLGVIADLTLDLGPGLTALTGETGAGKTLLVEAIELLVGGRADGVLVRPGASEAVVEGRFETDGDEIVLGRTVAAAGRSRASIDGRMSTVGALAETGATLVDLHGQHAHQSLLRAAAQRETLDAFAAVDLTALRAARRRVAALDAELAGLGGDEHARAREIDLLRFQLDEIDSAGIGDVDEEDRLTAEEDALADVAAHREAAAAAHAALTDDGGAVDAVGAALAAVAGRGPFADAEARLRSLQAELIDVAADVHATGDGLDDDPERLAAVRARRQLLRELRRKYGDDLAAVAAFADEARGRLAELEGHDERARRLDADRRAALADAAEAAGAVARARRAAAPRLAEAIEAHLHDLALPHAALTIAVGGDDPADDVRFDLSANPGTPPLPLTKIASGGELARTMLAVRLAASGGVGPATLVFDEVDAGIGGETALAVGRSLAELARHRQVLVVTHLPQVAAFADRQIAVQKSVSGRTTTAEAHLLDDTERVVELSRMLSGQPDSAVAHGHARELLSAARASRGEL